MTNLNIFFIILENTYRVHVFTGDVSNAGTNSNVFICVYGEHGDTGEQKLEKSETHMDKFERNNVRTALFTRKLCTETKGKLVSFILELFIWNK